jgi:hypothetical protein
MNQCDGCRRGLPKKMGIHRGIGWDAIGCTAHLYKEIVMKTCSRCHNDVEKLAPDARCSKCTDYKMYEEIKKEVTTMDEVDAIVEKIHEKFDELEPVKPKPKPKPKRKRKVKDEMVVEAEGDDQGVDMFDFLADIPPDADNYEVEKFDGEESDSDCGDACKI